MTACFKADFWREFKFAVRENRALHVFLFFVFSTFSGGCGYFSDSYESAVSLEESGKNLQAVEAYQKYLKVHSSGPLASLAVYRMAKNYETMLDIYINNYPETSIETLKQLAEAGFMNFKMAEATDKGLVMLGKIAQ